MSLSTRPGTARRTQLSWLCLVWAHSLFLQPNGGPTCPCGHSSGMSIQLGLAFGQELQHKQLGFQLPSGGQG